MSSATPFLSVLGSYLHPRGQETTSASLELWRGAKEWWWTVSPVLGSPALAAGCEGNCQPTVGLIPHN